MIKPRKKKRKKKKKVRFSLVTKFIGRPPPGRRSTKCISSSLSCLRLGGRYVEDGDLKSNPGRGEKIRELNNQNQGD
jgi:hypothetical protein